MKSIQRNPDKLKLELQPKRTLTTVTTVLVLLLTSIDVDAAPDDVEAPLAVPQAADRFQIDEATFDANVFQMVRNEQGARTQIESKLNVQLEEIQRVCGLTDAQKQKLKLAASSDIKRFFDDVAVVRNKMKAAGVIDQNAWNNLWQEIHPLRTKLNLGLFGDQSFFIKALRKTLNDEQFAKYDLVLTERRVFRYRAAIEVVLTNLDGSIPLRRDQQDSIVKLLLDETKPPQMFGQYDQQLVMYHLGKIREDKLKSLLEEPQWKQLKQLIANQGGNEQFLIQQGVIQKDVAETKLLKVRVRKRIIAKDDAANADQAENRDQDQAAP